jgi:hypothetical protein
MLYTLTQLNNQYVELDGMLDGTTKYLGDGVTLNPNPTYINNATGTFNVNDPTGALVANGGPITLNYIAGSNGDYRGLLTNAFNPATLGQGYTIKVDLTAPGGFVGHWELPAQVKARVM